MKSSLTAEQIMAIVVRYRFPPRQWAVCPNVSWGLESSSHFEADLLAASKSAKIHEVEIKISPHDFRADARKKKWAYLGQSYVDVFWYAVPPELEKMATERAIEINAGVLVCTVAADGSSSCRTVRYPKTWHHRPRQTADIRDFRPKIWRLCALRFWDLKFKAMGLPKGMG